MIWHNQVSANPHWKHCLFSVSQFCYKLTAKSKEEVQLYPALATSKRRDSESAPMKQQPNVQFNCRKKNRRCLNTPYQESHRVSSAWLSDYPLRTIQQEGKVHWTFPLTCSSLLAGAGKTMIRYSYHTYIQTNSTNDVFSIGVWCARNSNNASGVGFSVDHETVTHPR